MSNPNSTTDAVDTASDSARRIADAGAAALDQTKQAAQHKLEQGAERVAGSAHAAAESLRRAAGEVQTEHAWIGAALRKSADGIEAATQSLAGGDIERGMRDLNQFARRQPAIFLGAAFAMGFAMSRVGKTAIEKVTEERAADGAGPTTANGAIQPTTPGY